ncbi:MULTISPECIES: hypothetical protein [Arthrobacter]|uniref:Uncharacterized protein n=3 Tax=Arthrobacter TaxID=1663 RepID=A0ABU9KHQ9_9MICC|nr:hypothetical protein [Arthrobacter sp. YJM1]
MDLFQQAFGYDCVDEGFVQGTLGPRASDRISIVLGYDDVWPFNESRIASWSDDQLFDVIEFLYDHVSKGDRIGGYLHTFNDCGWHYRKFDAEQGRSEYRGRVNEILSRVEDGFELTAGGQIMRLAPEGLEPLLLEDARNLGESNQDHVRSAIHKFRSRASSSTQRRDAVRDLADVLENIRPDVKEYLFSEDERALFEIANKFWIRHNKPGERREYDHEAWWTWLFYLYLDSISLVDHLKEKSDRLDARD